ncbi:D-alanine aminotransferase [Halalkalibacter wakoensis JCM 9140]|uniref:D-alanine aminotransferase n=1 Tax=Halalkalibacter wakoensis JCM 9140 TaxID=1236970 RepID=W4PY28_9BACI|nr:D-amino-acid transaminase [Halalkalibacter wakoensis]GAE24580.1 D-alanine aminotransferase [Halalkalibacter wakoensis JCM 9140]
MEYIIQNELLLPKKEASIPLDDRGYYFGDGVYEVIKVYNGQLFAKDEHLQRLVDSAKKLEIPLPFSIEKMEELLYSLVEKNSMQNGLVYFQITRGVEPRNHLYSRELKSTFTAFVQPPQDVEDAQKNGVNVWLTDDIRWLRCDIKTINLLGNVMVKREAADHHCQEAIMHRNGTITEASSSNVFLVKDKILYTHPATNLILNGITRQLIIKVAKKYGYEVVEEPFPVEVLEHADEAFISNTSLEITPIKAVYGQLTTTFPIGPVTKDLQIKFKELM